ncbi:GlsB/YeaQ/YmgE family stress response membrane protein [Bradyrhizobium liaoningense]|uniref:GlsB/YeaQ/YmgE family stress response membrane protein n=1 Tax=Bradyrhizobium liaoningense TaxID=43992 RepID=UPI001BAC9CB3|nr:GlsB/YeaQ/YmgE family stress response membrane protein [Bradyrhizobium liaoningense]
MSIIWTIIIGFVAGVIAKFIMPGDNEPSGFILTTILGIVGAFVATYLGQSLARLIRERAPERLASVV